MKQTPQQPHIPVLLEQAVLFLAPQKGDSYLDLTAGYGGHARAVIASTGAPENAVLVDRDKNAIEILSAEFSSSQILKSDFLGAAGKLVEEGKKFDIILADLGVSSPQLDNPERGFSFQYTGPLDMRMDVSQDLTAEQLIRKSSEKELADIIVRYGEEKPKAAMRIAKALKQEPIPTNTKQAQEKIAAISSQKYHKIHPATRTFQALRIAVNDELTQVEEMLKLLPKLLDEGGRVGIISFHSLEDRLVKNYFKEQAEAGYEAELQVITKKPLSGDNHDKHNPRARSGKLRVASKIKINRKEI
ncbi:16S rRNA (cytosine(1402)-N(4))-methyltransferase RsmH [Candidatus Saccharibacteria bacterium]|nr:16S rRNA (cytosine(1402)-N(4))-methyltransferase RsmH [Candidatus Saccharibacteria bacterium]